MKKRIKYIILFAIIMALFSGCFYNKKVSEYPFDFNKKKVIKQGILELKKWNKKRNKNELNAYNLNKPIVNAFFIPNPGNTTENAILICFPDKNISKGYLSVLLIQLDDKSKYGVSSLGVSLQTIQEMIDEAKQLNLEDRN